jgi:hypothetical protein
MTVIRCDLYTLGLKTGSECLKVPRRRWYHILMKLFCLCAAIASTALAAVNPQLHEVKRVYVLAMGSGMDQYLANQLTKSGIFVVVTDPKKADAILTDNVGEAFEERMNDLYPPPAPPKKAPETTSADGKTSEDTKTSDSKPTNNDRVAGIDFGSSTPRVSSFGRGKGNFFVVDRNSRIVLWSVYERPKNTTPSELTKTAEKVVRHLKEDLTEKKSAE